MLVPSEHLDPLTIKPKDIIVHLYEIEKTIGSGGFGRVFRATNIITGKKVAIKVDDRKNQPRQCRVPAVSSVKEEDSNNNPKFCPEFENEYWALKHLEQYHGFPKARTLDMHENDTFIVMEILGTSIWNLFKMSNYSFPMKTLLLMMDQCLVRVQQMHEIGIIHGDIKPENMMMGIGDNAKTLYFIDFGLATMYWDYTTHCHLQKLSKCPIDGTTRYASFRQLSGIKKSRRDDLETLAYTFALFLRHEVLPWDSVLIDMRKVKASKSGATGATLFHRCPKEFALFHDQIRRLKFEDIPDYAQYRKMFRVLGRSLGINYDVDSLDF